MVRESDMRTPRRDTQKTNIGQSAPISILHPPRIHQNVLGPQAEILVDKDESRHLRLCSIMRYLSASKSRTPATCGTTSTTTYTSMEMGWDQQGLYSRAAQNTQRNDSIWVIVDRLTKVAHFIPVKAIYRGDKLTQLYTDNILRLHGVPNQIMSDRGT